MRLVPVKNRDISEEPQASGDILIQYPTIMKPWIAKWVRRFKGTAQNSGFRKLQLDNLGTEVWKMIDGKRTVQDIVVRFARIHQLGARESESAVTQFLRDLGKRGVIGLRE